MRNARLGLVAGLLLVGTACANPLGRANATLTTMARGVVIDDGGTTAMVGMPSGNTCFVNPKNGMLGNEWDFPGDRDEVKDLGRFEGLDSWLVTTPYGLHLGPADMSEWDGRLAEIRVGGLVDAVIGREDIGMLVQEGDACTAGWAVAVEGVPVDASACEIGRLAIDVDLGDLFVSTGAGVVKVPQDAPTEVVDAEADLVVYDEYTSLTYTAAVGDTWVRAHDSTGELWAADLGLPVVSIDDMGWQQGVLALVDAGDLDQLWILDPWTGEPELGDETPSGAIGLVASRNGRDFALVSDDQVAFRELSRHVRE